jgi:mono/diheme cytochrome c family protein
MPKGKTMRSIKIACLVSAVLLFAVAAVFGQESSSERAGKKLYVKYGCRSCHVIAGTGGSVGPALDNSSEKGRPFLEKIIKNAREVDPASIMPPFTERLNQDELTAIVDYLMAL